MCFKHAVRLHVMKSLKSQAQIAWIKVFGAPSGITVVESPPKVISVFINFGIARNPIVL